MKKDSRARGKEAGARTGARARGRSEAGPKVPALSRETEEAGDMKETEPNQETGTRAISLRNCCGRCSKPSFSPTSETNLYCIIQ